MYCNSCGAFIEDGNAHFCQSCGAPLEAPKQPLNTEYAQQNTFEQNNGYNPADFDNSGNSYSQGGYDNQQSGSYQPVGTNVNAENVNGDTAAQQNKKKTVIIAVSAVVAVALICAAVLASIFITSGKNGKSGNLEELKKGVRAQVVSEVPDSDYLQLRDKPSDKGEALNKVYEEEYVDIIGDYSSKNDGYVFVRHLEGKKFKEGWLEAKYLVKVSMSDEYKSLKQGARCRILSDSEKDDGLSLFSDASFDSDLILNIPEDEHVVVLKDYAEENGEFIMVEYVHDSEEYVGWVLGQFAVFDGWAKDFVLKEATTKAASSDRPELTMGAVCVIMNNTPYHDGVTMRAQASYNSNKVRVIAEGEYVIVTSSYKNNNNGYVLTTYNDGYRIYRGWISAKFLAYVTEWYGNADEYVKVIGSVPTTQESTTFYEGGPGSNAYKSFEKGDFCYIGYETVGHDGLNLRSGPSSSSRLIEVLEEGTYATVLKDYSSSDNGYIKVDVGGTVGYLIGKYLVYNGTSNTYDEPETYTEAPTTEEEDYFYVDESEYETETETEAEVITESDEIEVEVEVETPETEATTTTEATTNAEATTTTEEPVTEEPEVEVIIGPEGQNEAGMVFDD